MAIPTIHDFLDPRFAPHNVQNWLVQFESAPPPFDQFFPAVSANIYSWSLASHSFDGGDWNFKVPLKRAEPPMLTVSFLVDEQLRLYDWIMEWAKSISSLEGTLTYKEAAKPAIFNLYTSRNTLLSSKRLLVFPEGSMNYEGQSSGAHWTPSVTFNIVGETILDV